MESNIPFELTTPTGAGIAKSLSERYVDGVPSMRIDRIGYGAGTDDFEKAPNILRVLIGTEGQETVRYDPTD